MLHYLPIRQSNNQLWEVSCYITLFDHITIKENNQLWKVDMPTLLYARLVFPMTKTTNAFLEKCPQTKTTHANMYFQRTPIQADLEPEKLIMA